MNEIENVLSLFKTAEDWNSFVELSNMKDMMVRELKRRLLTEMRIIAESNLSGAGWEYDAKDDYIFHLPSSTMCLKALRHWTKRAGIKKHITWHCGRHSFATNILSNGANIKVVAELLGHSSLNYVQVYVRAMDEQKRNAIDGLSDFLEPTK